MIIFFLIFPLDLNQGLLASLIFLPFACSDTICFHFDAVLLVDLPPQGNMCCGKKIPIGISAIESLLVLVLYLMSVLSCVDALLSSEPAL